MPDDPVVSPADTIRQALEALDRERSLLDGRDYDAGELRDNLAALAALLAVGERDKAEREQLERDLAGMVNLATAYVDQYAEQRERDRRQIARLTEALIFWVRRARDFEAEVPERKAYLRAKGVTSAAYETGRRTVEESLPTVADVTGILSDSAVLAGEEDADNG